MRLGEAEAGRPGGRLDHDTSLGLGLADLAGLRQEGRLVESGMDARSRPHPPGNLGGFAGFDRIRPPEAADPRAQAREKCESALGHMPNTAAE